MTDVQTRTGADIQPERAGTTSTRRVVLLSAGVLAGRNFLFSRYWVGFDDDQVAVFQGVPGDVAGLRLSRLVERSTVTRDQVPTAYVLSLENGVTASSLADARRIATCAPVVYEQPDCTGATAATTTTVAPPTTAPATTRPKA